MNQIISKGRSTGESGSFFYIYIVATAHWFGSKKNGKLQNLLIMKSPVGLQIPLVGGPVPSLLLGGIETDHPPGGFAVSKGFKWPC